MSLGSVWRRYRDCLGQFHRHRHRHRLGSAAGASSGRDLADGQGRPGGAALLPVLHCVRRFTTRRILLCAQVLAVEASGRRPRLGPRLAAGGSIGWRPCWQARIPGAGADDGRRSRYHFLRAFPGGLSWRLLRHTEDAVRSSVALLLALEHAPFLSGLAAVVPCEAIKAYSNTGAADTITRPFAFGCTLQRELRLRQK